MKYLFLIYFLIFISCDSIKKKTSYSSKLVSDTLFFKTLNASLAYKTYLPINYMEKDLFPILYLLHGHGGHDDDWFNVTEGNAQHILDSLINNNIIPPMVAVTLDAGNSWYVDSKENMESAFIKEFMPFIEEKYKVNGDKYSRIIAGISAGGFGALRFSLKYPELFGSTILLSPAAYSPLPPQISSSRKIEAFAKDGVFNDSVWQSYTYSKLIDSSGFNTSFPKIYLSTGDDDEYQIFDVVNDLRTFFIENDILNETLVINGKHSWDVWQYCFTNDLVRIFKDDKLEP